MSVQSIHSQLIDKAQQDARAAFLRSLKHQGYAYHTLVNYERDLVALGRWYGQPIEGISSKLLRAYFESLTLKPASIQRKMASVRTFFNWCRCNDLRLDNPMDRVARVRGVRHQPDPLPAVEVGRILAYISDPRDRLITLLMKETGLRIHEVIKLKQCDVHWEEHAKITVIGKGGKKRTVPLVLVSTELLDLLYDATYQAENAYIFPGRKEGSHLGYHAFRDQWVKYCAKAGVYGGRIHRLRHSYASQMVERGCDISKLGVLMGHNSETTTRGYAVIQDKQVREHLLALR